MYWDVNPELFSLGPFTVRWYGIFFALSFLMGLRIMRWIFRRENKPEKDLYRLFCYTIIGSVVGARMGYCLCITSIAIGVVLLLLKNTYGFNVIKEFK